MCLPTLLLPLHHLHCSFPYANSPCSHVFFSALLPLFQSPEFPTNFLSYTVSMSSNLPAYLPICIHVSTSPPFPGSSSLRGCAHTGGRLDLQDSVLNEHSCMHSYTLIHKNNNNKHKSCLQLYTVCACVLQCIAMHYNPSVLWYNVFLHNVITMHTNAAHTWQCELGVITMPRCEVKLHCLFLIFIVSKRTQLNTNFCYFLT